MSKRAYSPLFAAVAIAALLFGCASPAPTVAPEPTAAATHVPCPNYEGGACLGPIDAGTYTTVVMNPKITYTVPEGWSNFEDTPGNFLLVPPGGSLEGVWDSTSDFIGIHTRVAAATYDCDPKVDGSVGILPKDIAEFFVTNPLLVSSDPEPTSIGGLDGYMVDVRQAEGAGIACYQWVLVPTFVGVHPSSLQHNVLPGVVVRHYLLEYGNATLVIEVWDATGGSRLDEYDDIVQQLVFGD